jgi:hypothetical protein
MSTTNNESNLARATLRTVAILVGACVIFVGVLSVIAVTVTSRAVNRGATEARTTEADPAVKKPLSI